jgi:hypothetical protein
VSHGPTTRMLCFQSACSAELQAFDTNRDGKIDTGDAMRSRQDLARREIGRTIM